MAFTGSTETAWAIQRALAARDAPIAVLVAETGGLNAMIADSSALPEQLIKDTLLSAFGSAGQRCSAARILLVQEDIAEKVLKMLAGAMAELRVGDPGRLRTDVGPIIDEEARENLIRHQERMEREAKLVARASLSEECDRGVFFAPVAFELQSLKQIRREVFGPILHVVRYKARELEDRLDELNEAGYGLTLGIHSRIDSTIERILARVRAGNRYVNRSMIGAVVGVQPFGGGGPSGTGPKAGGPHYLAAFLRRAHAHHQHHRFRRQREPAHPRRLRPMQGKRAVVLLSGGMDSAVALAEARAAGFTCHALSLDYGQRHAAELAAARRVAAAIGAAEHRIVALDLRAFGGSALTSDLPVPESPTNRHSITYVPAAHTVLASPSPWPGPRPSGPRTSSSGSTRSIIPAIPTAARSSSPPSSTWRGLRPRRWKARLFASTPLIALSKAEIVRRGLALGVDFALTVSCYQADAEGLACGRCDACRLRAKGFAEAGVPDPTRYRGDPPRLS